MALNILDRIAQETDLTKSERKLAATILKNPSVVINENIAQLSKRAGVSEPSVCRFCKRFGAEGFPAFKLVLSTLVSSQNLKSVESVKQGDTVEDVVSKVIASAKTSVFATERNIDESVVARVIDVVSQSRRIVLFSQGLSSFIAVDFLNRMMNLGFACESYTDKQSMALAAASLHTGDVVIAISASGINKDVISSSSMIKGSGACLIAITPENSKLAAISDLCLKSGAAVEILSEGILNNRLSLMLLSQVIIGGVMLRRGIAISDLKDKITAARMGSYEIKTAVIEDDVNNQSSQEEDDGSIKPGAPITTLDWRF